MKPARTIPQRGVPVALDRDRQQRRSIFTVSSFDELPAMEV